MAALLTTDFSVEVRGERGATVVVVSGELDLQTSPQLEERLGDAIRADAEVVVLDLRQVEFMDSTGLRVLITTHQQALEAGKRFGLVPGPEQIERVLRLTRVDELLTIVQTPEQLIEAGERRRERA